MNKQSMNNKKLPFWTITGLIDAEGSFLVNIASDKSRKLGYAISISLEMGMNYKDITLLKNIKYTLGLGNIYYNKNDLTYKWKVSSINELCDVIIPFLKQYYLVSQRRVDYELFVKIAEIIKLKRHLSAEGLQQIVDLKSSLNIGITKDLIASFPNTTISCKHKYDFKFIPDPYWLSGFSKGEACFFIRIYDSPNSKLGCAVQTVFMITQHSRDKNLLEGVAKLLDCGRVKKRKTEAYDYIVTSFESVRDKIVPFFEKYPLTGHKYLNYTDFKKVVHIIDKREHLAFQGMQTIKNIKKGMNTGRKDIGT